MTKRAIDNDSLRQFLCQRLFYNNQLNKDTQEELNNLPHWSWEWTTWDEKLYELYEFYLENQFYPTEGVLAEWVQELNSEYFKLKLSKSQLEKVLLLPEWEWDQDFNLKKLHPKAIKALMKWEKCYLATVKFFSQNDRLPCGHETYNKINLGEWIRLQRQRKREEVILQDQIDKLESLPGWTWNVYQKSWNETFNKHLSGELRNKSWLATQRRHYFEGKLKDGQIDKLESLPGWSWNPFKAHRDKRINDLEDFIKEFNRLPQKEEWYKGKKIGSWCIKKRLRYKKGLLSQDEINQFNFIENWSWNPLDEKLTKKWNQALMNLSKFIKKNNRLPYKSEGTIGQWVNRQHQRNRIGVMSKEQVKVLEEIPEWVWNPRDVIWKQRFQELLDYIDENGSFPLHSKHKINSWCTQQKKRYREGSLQPERKMHLESIKIWEW